VTSAQDRAAARAFPVIAATVARPRGIVAGVMPGTDQCHRALRSRDRRFDGWFFPAVISTGIYCRPSCPAITPTTPKAVNLRFFPTAAAAQDAGFRACRRCRPDAVPGSPLWDERADVAARAMRLIEDGVVDREGVTGLAARLGYTPRHLGRLVTAELGAGPRQLARARRAHIARLLLETTTIPITDVAFAAGFGSVRQFNETIRAVFASAPTDVRLRAGRPNRGGSPAGGRHDAAMLITLRLPCREPYDWGGVWSYLAERLVPGLEEMDSRVYRRGMRLPHGAGVAELESQDGYLRAAVSLDDLRDLAPAVARLRRLTHADADPAGVVQALGEDTVLGPLVRARPGLRVPGSVDPFETAVRAVIGQQISIQEARSITANLVRSHGTPLRAPAGSVTHVFPAAEQLAGTGSLPMPARRARTVTRLAAAICDGQVELGGGADRREVVAQLLRVPGVDLWTAEYIALRGLRDPDAFPMTDHRIQTAFAILGITGRIDVIERWRPLRSYAAQHLWTGLATGALTPGGKHSGAPAAPPRQPT
jgi:AraC family transcriptional regulator, regulatory protein of adaptative response / DNA-3-methyladenine glycosylase II